MTSMKAKNGFDLSDFAIDIYEREDSFRVRVDCFVAHPYDRQEYWRTKNGRIYPKDHTVHCPKNPAN